MKRHTTLLLAEADLCSAAPLVLGLQDAGFRTLYAPDGHWALQLARTVTPDLVLLDAQLPRMDGFAVCRTLRWESRVPILLLTTRDEEQVRALELGADACLVKPFRFRELLARVHALLRRRALNGGNGHPPADRIAVGDIVLDRASRQAWRAGCPIRLRRREFDLLWALMEDAGRAIPRQELLARVWGKDWVGNPRTLDVHIRWLREKLEEDPSTPRYIQTLRGYGPRFVGVGD
jgi:DNA-binding response OmpR family regulator